MNVIGFGGLHQSVEFKRRMHPGLSEREYRIAQGFDSAAALVTSDGIVAAAAEERFSREKTTGAFPVHALRYCLAAGRLRPSQVDVVAHAFDYAPHRAYFDATEHGRLQYAKVFSPEVQRQNLDRFFPGSGLASKLVAVQHHLAHAASAFYPSGFPDALILVSDGMGEVQSATVAFGEGRTIRVLHEVPALHSVGILYGVFTMYLGFDLGVDEYKVMGLAPYGNTRTYYQAVSDLVRLGPDGGYTIPMFASNRTELEKETHSGALGELARRFGPPRARGAEITQHHKDLAAALQATLQTCQLHVLRHFQQETGAERLCLAGGVALNCSANGVIRRSRLFRDVFVQPASGDDGAALGAALHVQHTRASSFVSLKPTPPLYGPAFSPDEIRTTLAARPDCVARPCDDFAAMCRHVAEELSNGLIVGWFQDRMEYGPRALGNRSILADPRDPAMRDRLNILVKKREGFRPFAPIVTKESARTYFEIDESDEDAYAQMLFVTGVRPPYRDLLPAITHVDGSARVQTVSRETYPKLWQLLKAFEAITGVPVLLNTSFNVKGQPLVCTPTEALDTFLVTGLDLLVLGDDLVVAQGGKDGRTDREAAAQRISIGVG